MGLRNGRLPLPPLYRAHLPVWPSSRRFGPPPCSVRTCGCSGEVRVGSGECCSTDLPRRWRSSDNQRVFVDPDLGFGAEADGRRLEIVVDGLRIFSGAQLAVDTTLVCALRRDGRPTTRAAVEDGVRVTRARRRKEATDPELVGRRARTRLVVLGVEVGGRFPRRHGHS